MTPANARHHLAILEEQGLVEVAGQRSEKTRGRPAQLYRLSEQAIGDNLDQLASALLHELISGVTADERKEILQRVANRMRGDPILEDAQKPAAQLAQRLYQAIQRLNELKYQARWEAHSDGPRVVLGHCPYAAILPEHPMICQLDRQLLEEFLELPVKQTARLASDARGATYCMFVIGKR